VSWWTAATGEAHDELIGFVTATAGDRACVQRQANRTLWREVYGAPGARLVYGEDAVASAATLLDSGLFTYNLIRVVVDSVGARLATAKPRVTFVTNGGSWSTQVRARRLQRYVQGVMRASSYHREQTLVVRDAGLGDVGLLEVLLEPADVGGQLHRIAVRRADPDEIFVDTSADGYYGRPLAMTRGRILSLGELEKQVEALPKLSGPERKAKLAAVRRASWTPMRPGCQPRAIPLTGEVRGVAEGWFPSANGGEGRYVMACDGITIIDQPMDFFPFAPICFIPPLRGWYGAGLAERVWRAHVAICEVLDRLSVAWQQMAKPAWWLPAGSTISTDQLLSPYVGAVIKGGTAPPQVMTNRVLDPAHIQMVDWQIRRGLEEVGLTEIATSGQKPAGLDSGVALREASDLVSGRQAMLFDAIDHLAIGVKRNICAMGRWANRNGIKLAGEGARGGRPAVEWEEAELDEAAYVLEALPSSSLPATPAARRQAVQELFAQGIIGADEYRELIEMPDIEAANSLELAAREWVDLVLERFLEDEPERGENVASLYTPPTPFSDVGYALRRGIQVANRAQLDGAPEERLELVRQFVLDAQHLAALAAAPPPLATPAGPSGAPPPNLAAAPTPLPPSPIQVLQ